MTASNVQVVVSGRGWLGSGFISVETALFELLTKAENEITIVAYSIGGIVGDLTERLEQVVQRGVKVQIIVNRFSDQPQNVQNWMKSLQLSYLNLVKIYSFDQPDEHADLHAKIILVDRKHALIGSANLSLRGMRHNHELALMLQGRAVYDIGTAIDTLLKSSLVKTLP